MQRLAAASQKDRDLLAGHYGMAPLSLGAALLALIGSAGQAERGAVGLSSPVKLRTYVAS